MVRWVAFAALVSSGCRFDADYGGTSYRCDDRPICPGGFICIDGVCRSQPIDAGVDPDAAPPSQVLGDILTYTFDDYEPTDVAHDRSGHRHDGSDRSLSLAAGQYGQGLSLNGSPLEIPDTGRLHSPGRMTVEMWLFRDTGSKRQALFSDYDAAQGPPETELSLEITEDDRLQLLLAPGCQETGVVTAESDREVPVTVWTHVAAVWEEDEIRFYLDGEEAGSAPIGAGCERSNRFAIGARTNGNYALTGVVDEFKVSSAAKSPAMIQASMNWDSQAAASTCDDLLIEEEEDCDGPGLCCASCRQREDATACNGDLGTCMAGACLGAGDLPRVTEGLVALYRFDDMSGMTIADSSGSGAHLTIANAGLVTWGEGTLEVEGEAGIASGEEMLVSGCMAGDAVSIEAWVQAYSASREGRVAGLIGAGAINLSLSQGARAWTAGVNSTGALENGHPVVDTPPTDVSTELTTHLVMSRSADGWRRLYVDGALRGTNRVEGTLEWEPTQRVVLASDLDGSDSWRGTYHLVALYCRALDETEVAQNFVAGAD